MTGLGFSGNYTTTAGDGSVIIVVTANGDPLDSSEKTISVYVLDGPYAGYQNSGAVQRGNV